MHFIWLVQFVLHQMHFIPSSLNTQFLRYGPFTDMGMKCSLATFQHFYAKKRAFMVTIDGSSKLGNWLSVKPCCFNLYFSYILDLLLGFLILAVIFRTTITSVMLPFLRAHKSYQFFYREIANELSNKISYKS